MTLNIMVKQKISELEKGDDAWRGDPIVKQNSIQQSFTDGGEDT